MEAASHPKKGDTEMMDFMMEQYVKFMTALRSERGQTLVEYALLLVLIAIVVIAAVTFLGGKTCNVYTNIGSKLSV
jgi:pilus assembly protein Flp/PilA